ncbi:MAG: hypothetical protein HRT52_04090 [Colwellia sp.]|nr:hypothetical protein [Colwellia sp.]
MAKQPVVEITVETDIYNYAMEVLDGQSPLEINDFSGKNSLRDVVEFILVQKALALGGSQIQFSFTLGNYDARNAKLLRDGLLLIGFDSIWLSQVKDLQDDVYISDEIIRKGEYWAGIYTSQENKKKMKINNVEDFKRLSVVSSRHWLVDWQTLTAIAPKKLMHEDEWLGMAKLVDLGWIDVMLAPFTKNRPFSYQGDGYKIVAVDGVKISLNDSRHFVVSRKHPLGKETFIALQKGLKILRKQGVIDKAFRQAGFFNPHVKDWTIINQHLLNTP